MPKLDPMIESKPYRLKNKIQHYDWGTKNENAFIPKFLGHLPEKDKPYAELWIGAHPKAPSSVIIGDREHALDLLISKFPEKILGERTAEKFGNKLPYLLKILSSKRALSIQAHPDKKLAKLLHAKDPRNYPDENHKPEVAIALDGLTALVGFKPFKEILDTIEKYPSILQLFPKDLREDIFAENYKSSTELLKKVYSLIMRSGTTALSLTIEGIRQQIQNSKNNSKEEEEFIRQYEIYGVDVGLLSILLFNILDLHEGEAIFTRANVPHAYLKGNIIECMANSDNVIRAGLTNKFKDVDTLLEMLTYDNSPVSILRSQKSTQNIYKTPAEEYELTVYSIGEDEELEINTEQIIIGLVIKGKIKIGYADSAEDFSKGNSFLIPAILEHFNIISLDQSKIVIVRVPKIG